MKSNQPIVRFVLKKNRQMRDGTYPIYVCISFHGRVERAIGISVKECDWNEKRQMAKSSCPNYLHINKEINSLRSDVNSKIIDFGIRGQEYTIKDLLDDKPVITTLADDVLYDIVAHRTIDHYTVKTYIYSLKMLETFLDNRNVDLRILTPELMKSFGKWLKIERGLKDNSIAHVLGKICSICSHAVDKNVLASNPFAKFRYNRIYRKTSKVYYLSEEEMLAIRDYFFSIMGDNLQYRLSEAFAVAYFLAMYKFNGSAPIDVAFIKASDIEIRSYNGNDYYCTDFNRHKTNTSVRCRIKKDTLTEVIIGEFMEHACERDGYLYPVLQNNYRNMNQNVPYAKLKERLSSLMKKITIIFRSVLVKVNRKYGLNIDVRSVTPYTMRHTMANLYLQQPKASIHGLATIMARNPNSIAVYVHQLRNDEEIIRSMDEMLI